MCLKLLNVTTKTHLRSWGGMPKSSPNSLKGMAYKTPCLRRNCLISSLTSPSTIITLMPTFKGYLYIPQTLVAKDMYLLIALSLYQIRKQAHNRQLTEPSYEEQVQSEGNKNIASTRPSNNINNQSISPFLHWAVFKQMRIPRSLGDVKNPAGEIDSVKNQGSRLVHGAVTGMRSDLTGTNTVPEILAQQQWNRVVVTLLKEGTRELL